MPRNVQILIVQTLIGKYRLLSKQCSPSKLKRNSEN